MSSDSTFKKWISRPSPTADLDDGSMLIGSDTAWIDEGSITMTETLGDDGPKLSRVDISIKTKSGFVLALDGQDAVAIIRNSSGVTVFAGRLHSLSCREYGDGNTVSVHAFVDTLSDPVIVYDNKPKPVKFDPARHMGTMTESDFVTAGFGYPLAVAISNYLYAFQKQRNNGYDVGFSFDDRANYDMLQYLTKAYGGNGPVTMPASLNQAYHHMIGAARLAAETLATRQDYSSELRIASLKQAAITETEWAELRRQEFNKLQKKKKKDEHFNV